MTIGIDARLWSESGVGRYTQNLIYGLSKIDKQNQYVIFLRKGDNPNLPQNFKKVFTDIHWHTLKEQLMFPKILDKQNLDLMHFPYFSVPIFYNKPFIVTIHDLIYHHFPTGKSSTHSTLVYNFKLLSYKYIIQKAAQKAQKIIAVSNATKQEIISTLKTDKNKITVVAEGVSNDLITQKAEKSSNGKYFLYVGNAYPHKNLDRLTDAFGYFNKNHPDVKLFLVGKEDVFYKRLKDKIKNRGLEQNVKFEGHVTDIGLSNLYANAIGLIAPSLMEGFGLPVLEAMRNKCLVLSSDIPAFKEILKDNALYFDPKNTEDILKAMEAVYSEGSKNKTKDIIEKAFKLSLEFSWEKMVRETLKVYESCFSL